MIVDCHTHLWRAEHWSEEVIREAGLARGQAPVTQVEEEEHWKAVGCVDRAIVFGFHARLSRHPEKLIGFACLDPNKAGCLEERHRRFERHWIPRPAIRCWGSGM